MYSICTYICANFIFFSFYLFIFFSNLQTTCTPLGMQQSVIINDQPWGLPLQEHLLPEILRDNGYATNLIGKWHLGFWRKELTPTMRGFDHHFGYYSGYIDYYNHTMHMLVRASKCIAL